MANPVEELPQHTKTAETVEEREAKKKRALEVLARLRERYDKLPLIDAEALIREGRDSAADRFED